MSSEDLKLCWLPHATSKISSEDDLYTLRTLGFRGEALSSIAAVSKLEMISAEGEAGYRILIHGGNLLSSEPWHARKGTVVEVTDLFYTLPGRKKFLKQGSVEGRLCRGMFLDKALPFPEISFKLFSDGELKLFLPASDPSGRIADAYRDQIDPAFLMEAEGSEQGFAVRAVCTTPDCFRKDRKFIQIFVNRRRINEYSLVQAVEYGFSEYMPGGRFPNAFIFIEIDPELVDFNIHPAKREAKFRNLSAVHHRLSETLRTALSGRYRESLLRNPNPGAPVPVRELFTGYVEAPAEGTGVRKSAEPESRGSHYDVGRAFPPYPVPGERLSEVGERIHEAPDGSRETDFRYLGQVMGVFLVAARGERLYLIDQHAAHERIIFNRLSTPAPVLQSLLIPFTFEATDDEDAFIRDNLVTIESAGIRIERERPGTWSITAVPETCRNLLGEVVSWVRGEGGDVRNGDRDFFATMACRSAVKDGDPVDELTAREIVRGAFELEVPRCPHGRPVWVEFSKSDLYRLVERT